MLLVILSVLLEFPNVMSKKPLAVVLKSQDNEVELLSMSAFDFQVKMVDVLLSTVTLRLPLLIQQSAPSIS